MGAGIVSICIGIVFLWFSFKPFKIKNAAYTKGEVCAREYHRETGDEHALYYITIRYFVKNIEYYSRSDFRQTYIKDGKKMLLKYNKDNPNECIIIPNFSGSVIFILFGIYAILSTLGVIPAILG